MLGRSGQGFLGHLVLAMTPGSTREPLGVLRVEQLIRPKGKMSPPKLIKEDLATYAHTLDMEKEQDRWGRGVRKVARVVDDSERVIHVMDSEADDYKLMAMMAGGDGQRPQRFVIRLRYDRALDLEQSGAARVSGAIECHSVVATRDVPLCRQKKGPSANRRIRQAQREGRPATLQMRAADVALKRPGHYPKRGLPEALTVNVVEVREADPPEGQEPVEWLLVTTEPIDTPEQILAVVDYYRSRWVIEEYFKAPKTGCAMEKRQLDSAKTFYAALALCIPIAWNLLRLRTFARSAPELPTEKVLTDEELEVLAATEEAKLGPEPTVREAMLAVARLGGHLRSNGEPGWEGLGRGYWHLLTMVAGYRLAKKVAAKRQ